jgi:hypothetical protein
MKYSLRSLMPKRRWFQFRLKTILVAPTLFAVGLGGRIEYLRRMATFHGREANQFYMKYEREGRHEDFDETVRHLQLRDSYNAAIFRPWAPVDFTPPAPIRID